MRLSCYESPAQDEDVKGSGDLAVSVTYQQNGIHGNDKNERPGEDEAAQPAASCRSWIGG
jgi:hypothetical protein